MKGDAAWRDRGQGPGGQVRFMHRVSGDDRLRARLLGHCRLRRVIPQLVVFAELEHAMSLHFGPFMRVGAYSLAAQCADTLAPSCLQTLNGLTAGFNSLLVLRCLPTRTVFVRNP